MNSPAHATTPSAKFHAYQNPYKSDNTDSSKFNSTEISVNRFSPSKDNTRAFASDSKIERRVINELQSADNHFGSTFKHITEVKNQETLQFSSSHGRRERKISDNQHKLTKTSSNNPELTNTSTDSQKQIQTTPVERMTILQKPVNNQPNQIQIQQSCNLEQPSRPNIPANYEHIHIIFKEDQLKPAAINQTSNQLTWTKYLSLQFKNQELIKQLRFFKQKLNSAQNFILFLESDRCQMEKFFIKQIQTVKASQDQVISKIKQQYQNKIQQKNSHIKNLIDKMVSDAVNTFDEEIKGYFTKIQQENVLLSQKFNNKSDQVNSITGELQNLRETVQRLEGRQKSYQQSIKKMYEQLAHVTNSLSFKNKNSYEVIIKAQLSEINDLRKNAELMNDENTALRDKINNLQRQLDNVYNQLNVADLKQKAEKNKLVTEFGIESNNKTNQIQILKRKMSTLQDKYRLSVNDIKAKDEFIRTHLVGRVDEAEMKNYINNFLSKYADKFKIETHSHNECKQVIESLKKKLQLYERSQ